MGYYDANDWDEWQAWLAKDVEPCPAQSPEQDPAEAPDADGP